MPSDEKTGALLRSLAASKPGGHILELGTGTGLATAWLLDGMDAASRLVSIELDEAVLSVARKTFADDDRASFILGDARAFIDAAKPASFDIVFADAMPGKYEGLHAALSLVRIGGFYVGDDMLPQTNWPDGHQARVDQLVRLINGLPGWAVMTLDWGSGLIVGTRTAI
jgi:predicted O-methyltransferase YrrM